MGGGGQQSSTVTNRTEIDPVTQAWRNNIMGAGGQLYNQGHPTPYPNSQVIPFSNQTQSGLNYLQDYAQQGAPNIGGANDAAMRSLSGWNPAHPYANQFASGQSPFITNIYGAAGQHVAPQVAGMVQNSMWQNPWGNAIAQSGMTPTTAGVGALNSFANAENPYLDSLFNRGAERVSNAVNSNFAQAGRFGANAAHTGALTQGMGDLYSSIYAPAYENAQNRALNAAGQLASVSQADRGAAMQGLSNAGSLFEAGAGRGLQGAGMLGELASQDATRGLSGATTAAGYGLQGADLMGGLWSQGNADAARTTALLPGLYQYGQMPGQSMLDIGGMYEDLAGRYLQDDVNRYNAPYQNAWDHLGNYSQLMSGLPDFSSTTQTTTGPRTNRMMSGLGGASAGAGIAQALSLGGPWGWGLAAAGGLLGMSDRRLKREITPLGTHINGTPVYSFAYHWDEPGTRRVGVMADEAPAHAVHTHPSGFAMVDYAAL